MKHSSRPRLLIAGMLALLMVPQTVTVFAAPGGKSSGSSVSYSGANTITSDTSSTGQTYASSTAGENALLVSGGTSTLKDPSVTKSGSPDGSSDDYDFYGANAAVLVYNGAELNIEGGSVATDANYASAVFAYGTGVINISDATIRTEARNSGGLMVTGGGTLTANDLDVSTTGNSSAAIRSDRGGGTLTVNGGTYTVSGTGSPAIYSTADITVNDATLISTASEGVVVEGENSVTLNGVTLTDTNTTHNGNSTTDKNIFLYQSMSGDAGVGTSEFTAADSTITTNRGDTFYITNTNAEIDLTNNTFVNTSGDFLRAEAAAWGDEGSNGGQVTLALNDQEVEGDIIIDDISTLDMTLNDGSAYEGTINGENTAESIALTLDSSSTITLTGDSYVTELTNEDSSNSNIILNGCSLYVNGTAVSANDAQTDAEDSTESGNSEGSGSDADTDSDDGTGSDSASNTDSDTGKSSDRHRGGDTGTNTASETGSDTKESTDRQQGGTEDRDFRFNDVAEDDDCYDAVRWAVEKDITTGTGDSAFSPDQNCTRGQVVTFLWRAAGCPETADGRSFADVAPDSYCSDAVRWAVNTGITKGTGDMTFSPEETCTRAQAVTFLWRAAGCPAADTDVSFADVEKGSYYSEAVEWAVNNSVTNGTGQAAFSPDRHCTRGQIVTFLYRLHGDSADPAGA